MKPITLTIALFMLIVSTENSSAQSTTHFTLNQAVLITGSIAPDRKGEEIKPTSVNIKAVRDFNRIYKNIPDAKWFTTKKGYAVSFNFLGKNIKVEYNRDGWRLYSIISYTEKDLDFNIRDLVKRNYYDSDIIGVHQFEFENNKTVYLIKMMDRQSKVTSLKVYDGQIEDISSGK